MSSRTQKMLAGFVVAAALVPSLAFAQTTTDSQSQIQSILSQIHALELQLKTLIASSSPSGITNPSSEDGKVPPGQLGKALCITLNRNLGIGSKGDDVKSLQELLSEDSSAGFTGTTTGFFGPLTARALMRFQMNNSIASSTNGTVGPLTRGFFNRHCGKGLGKDNGQGGDQQGQNGDANQRGSVTGQVTANSGSSITVQGSGSSRTVNITSATMIQIFTGTSTAPKAGSTTDLTTGTQVMVQGTVQSDNSITALLIRAGFPLANIMHPEGEKGSGHDN